MTLDEIAGVRPELLDFTAGMLGGLARKDQRAAGELYVRGLLADGRRKSMVPMAERLGADPQRLQQFITSSTWDYAGVRRSVARWFAASLPVEALVVDDTGFPKDGDASPFVARQYSGTLGKTGNCQVAVSVHLAGEGASCAADWRLFCPESWDDKALDDPVAAAAARRRRERAGIPAGVRHREKWRLALDMIDEMTGPGGWGILEEITPGGARPVTAADAGYGGNALFRRELAARGWQYAVAVKGGTTAYDGDAVPQARPYGGLGQPPKPAYPAPPATLRALALAHAPEIRPVTWRHGTKASPGNPGAAMTSSFLAIRVRPASRHIARAADRAFPACHLLAEWPPEAEEPTGYWLSTLPENTPTVSTGRWYEGAVRLFCEYVTDPRYEWAEVCDERFGRRPVQVFHEWNSVAHVSEYEGAPARRPLTYDEVQALFDAADGRAEEIRARGRKGALAALRDAAVLKTVYAYGLRRREACGLDLADLRHNPKAPQYGRHGGLFVRWGKASRGGPPRRRTVLTVPEMDWITGVLEHWVSEVRPAFGPGSLAALWVTERVGRLSARAVDDAFTAASRAAGLPAELDLHCLRHAYITHLVEFDYPERFVSEQAGHRYASTTAIYTGVSDDYRSRLVRRSLEARPELWEGAL